jgi:hypothetical protein
MDRCNSFKGIWGKTCVGCISKASYIDVFQTVAVHDCVYAPYTANLLNHVTNSNRVFVETISSCLNNRPLRFLVAASVAYY